MRSPLTARNSPCLQKDRDWYTYDPTTVEAYSKDPLLLGRIPLHLPPRPGKPGWQNRCFKCLVRGHATFAYRAPVRACARCLQPGHGFSSCPKSAPKAPARRNPTAETFAALQPNGNLGDALLPANRIPIIDVYMPASLDSIDDLRYLNRGVVFDGRLKPGTFSSAAIQATLLLYAPKAAPFPILHMKADCFLLLLQGNTDRASFIASVRSNLESIGLVVYPWSPAIDAKPINYTFKVWLDLHEMPIQAWNKRHLLPLVAQFGLLLHHTPFTKVESIEKMRILVAVCYLEDVPMAARLFFRGLKLPIPLTVVSWIEELLTIQPPWIPLLRRTTLPVLKRASALTRRHRNL